MSLKNNDKYYYASDLVLFSECSHAIFLKLTNQVATLDLSDSDKLFKEKGLEHELNYLEILKKSGKKIAEIPKDLTQDKRYELTHKAMEDGCDIIYQAALEDGIWRGDADFLIKCDLPSKFGQYGYEILDVKLSHQIESVHILQLCFYSELLSKEQKAQPDQIYLYLGNGEVHSLRIDDFFLYYAKAKNDFSTYISNLPETSYPRPCSYCKKCQWQNDCNKIWQEDDHLYLLANIKKDQIIKLNNAGIMTIEQLANQNPDIYIPKLRQETFFRLRNQAKLQHHKSVTGENIFEIMETIPGKGFERLPMPDNADLFFDMEGDPLYPKGLEYLFGIYYFENNREIFRAFWAHNHDQEREIFETFMLFVLAYLQKYPEVHIYHYNHYEVTALTRLAGKYNLYEQELEELIKSNKFIDLYKVVRESIQTSECGYSIKNLEVFYMQKRGGSVTNAVDSIVVYNKWRQLRSQELLDQIERYNKTDCESTYLLLLWLLKIKPNSCETVQVDIANDIVLNDFVTEKNRDKELQHDSYRAKLALLGKLGELVANILEFHNRENKPIWRENLERQNKLEDELIEDQDCIASMILISMIDIDKNSIYYKYSFPEQNFKAKLGKDVYDVYSGERIGSIIDLDYHGRFVTIKRSKAKDDKLSLPKKLWITTLSIVPSEVLRKALYRYADLIIDGKSDSLAITQLLSHSLPRITGLKTGTPIVNSDNLEEDLTNAIVNLDRSYLFIQGPPGTGKTYISANIITKLLASGKKVGVTSNSHEAIKNLLSRIERIAFDKKISFLGIRKANEDDDKNQNDGQGSVIIRVEKRSEKAKPEANPEVTLFAGTAWYFADKSFDFQLDYLFVEEAGQLSLANLIAIGMSAKNIILVGDQMQLSQPTQGVHPGSSGYSILQFLLHDDIESDIEQQTISPEKGVFLDMSYRMSPEICDLISKIFYNDRLHFHPAAAMRQLALDDIGLSGSGVKLIIHEKEGIGKKNVQEAQIVQDIYLSLIGKIFIDHSQIKKEIGLDDILVISPYNLQVDYIKSILPQGAKVGTVDKFQGQEAPIVLISMSASSQDDISKDLEFLLNKQRLNVALSRAQCFAILILHKALLKTKSNSIKQIKLINTFYKIDHLIKNDRHFKI